MKRGLTRRNFIKAGAALGATAAVGGSLVPELLAGESVDIAAIRGTNAFNATNASVAALGGMNRFVSKGSKVLIIANTVFKHRGSIVSPEVLLATMTMCAEVGAKRITLLKGIPDGYWERCPEAAEARELIAGTAIARADYKVLPITEGVALKEAHVDRSFLEADAVINLSIAKHHKGCEYSGILKNTMGACPHDPTCRFFHFGANTQAGGWYEEINHLSQCVADLNLVRSPELCLLDASEILTTNGPYGPGKLATPQTVVAGADPVAVDAYGVRFLGLKPEAVSMIARSEKHGLGSADLDKLSLHESALG